MFVIVEKLFGIEQETEDEDAPEVCENICAEAEKEMENNNCINLIASNPTNGFSKRLSNDSSKAVNEVIQTFHLETILLSTTKITSQIFVLHFSSTYLVLQMQPFLEKKNGYSQLPNGYKDTHKNCFITNGTNPVLSCNELSDTLKGLLLDEAKGCLKKLAKTSSSSADLSKDCSKKDNLVGASGNQKTVVKEKTRHITGYLNLMANIIDNFTHGLAVGGSFLVSFRLGALTTFAILVHEIPHEIGDFAILLRSGFNRWDAARAQLLTATGGILGAMVAILSSSGEVGG